MNKRIGPSNSLEEEELKEFRLFISGLNPLTKPKELIERFNNFGKVISNEFNIGGLNLDANGKLLLLLPCYTPMHSC